MQPIEKSLSLAELAYERIKYSILDTTLKPGQVIYEPHLAESLEISRTPVREALIRLEQEGWIESARGRGFTVKPLLLRDIEDVYEMRLLLEPRAAGYFAEHADDEQITELVEPIAEIEAQIEVGNYDLYFHVHRKLHQAIVDHCPNGILQQILVSLDERMQRIRTFTGFDPHRHVHASFREQKSVLEALKQRDARQVEVCVAAHVKAARERVLAQLEAFGAATPRS